MKTSEVLALVAALMVDPRLLATLATFVAVFRRGGSRKG